MHNHCFLYAQGQLPSKTVWNVLYGATVVQVIPERFRSKLSDFHNSGYDRGHMAPALNHKSSQQDMDDTFFQTAAGLMPSPER